LLRAELNKLNHNGMDILAVHFETSFTRESDQELNDLGIEKWRVMEPGRIYKCGEAFPTGVRILSGVCSPLTRSSKTRPLGSKSLLHKSVSSGSRPGINSAAKT